MVDGMLTGFGIFVLGMMLGYLIQLRPLKPPEPPKNDPYDKYRNQDGLFSRKK